MNISERNNHNKRITDSYPARPHFSHIKPYPNHSVPDSLSAFASYKAKQDMTLLEFQLLDSKSSSTSQVKDEEINYLKSTIDSLEKQLRDQQVPSSSSCKKCFFYERDSKKLRENLSSSQNTVDRLYQESKILTEQLNLLQVKLENMPESNESLDSLKVHLKNLVFEVEADLNQELEEIVKKMKMTEGKIDRLQVKQLKQKSAFALKEHSLSEVENQDFIEMSELAEKNSRQVEEYQQEIYRLGLMIVRFQEKYEALLLENKEKLNFFKSENFKLKEELNFLLLKADEKHKSITKIPVLLSGQGSGTAKLASKKKLIEDYKQQIDFINETHNEQLEKLHKELESLRFSYAQQETILLSSEKMVKSQQDLIKSATSPLKSQILELQKIIQDQESMFTKLKEENQKLKQDIKELSQSEVSKKYSKLIIEFQTFQSMTEEAHTSLLAAEEKIKVQEEIINSLKLGFYPHNSPQELLNPEKTNEVLLLQSQIDRKTQLIEEMRNQMLTFSQEHERDKHTLQSMTELYNSSREEVKNLEKIIESMRSEADFNLTRLKSSYS